MEKRKTPLSASPIEENLTQVKEIANKRELNTPFNETELRRFTMEEITFYLGELQKRIQEKIQPELEYLEKHRFQIPSTVSDKFKFDWYDNELTIKFDEKIVYQPDYNVFFPGEWIDELPNFVESVKTEIERNRIVNESNQRDNLIARLTGKKVEGNMDIPF